MDKYQLNRKELYFVNAKTGSYKRDAGEAAKFGVVVDSVFRSHYLNGLLKVSARGILPGCSGADLYLIPSYS